MDSLDSWIGWHYTQKYFATKKKHETRNNVILFLVLAVCLLASGLAETFFINL